MGPITSAVFFSMNIYMCTPLCFMSLNVVYLINFRSLELSVSRVFRLSYSNTHVQSSLCIIYMSIYASCLYICIMEEASH